MIDDQHIGSARADKVTHRAERRALGRLDRESDEVGPQDASGLDRLSRGVPRDPQVFVAQRQRGFTRAIARKRDDRLIGGPAQIRDRQRTHAFAFESRAGRESTGDVAAWIETYFATDAVRSADLPDDEHVVVANRSRG